MNIFSKIKIIDLTRVFSGPFATRHFADFGANVIKIEPLQGDDSRNYPPRIDNWSGYFEVLNRNKQSIFLNLKNTSDLEKFYILCEDADVLVENFTPNVKKNLKIDYKNIKKINPQIIYASISGVSPQINKKYYDLIAQAESGLISLNGEKDDMKISTSVVDAFSGMKLAFAISAALFNKERTNQGDEISVSMKGSAFDLLEQNLIEASIAKENPQKIGNMDSAIAPFGIFKTKDKNISLAIGNEIQWNNFSNYFKKCSPSLNNTNFSNNLVRIKNIDKLKIEIEKIFYNFSSKDILKILTNLDIPAAPINTMMDVINDQENFDENLLKKIKHPIAGDIIVPVGGIFFSKNKKEKYRFSPNLND